MYMTGSMRVQAVTYVKYHVPEKNYLIIQSMYMYNHTDMVMFCGMWKI